MVAEVGGAWNAGKIQVKFALEYAMMALDAGMYSSHCYFRLYSDTSANEDNSFRSHIR